MTPRPPFVRAHEERKVPVEVVVLPLNYCTNDRIFVVWKELFAFAAVVGQEVTVIGT